MSPPVSAMMTWANLLADAGDGLQQFELMRPRPKRLGDRRVQLGQRPLDQGQPGQHGLGQLGVAVVEVPCQRLGQLRDLAPHPGPGQVGEHRRVTFPVDHRGQHRPRRHRGDAGRHRGQLDAGVLQHQFQPDAVAGAVAHQLQPVAGQQPQPTDLRWRHE
jgi:hypothetical protein